MTLGAKVLAEDSSAKTASEIRAAQVSHQTDESNAQLFQDQCCSGILFLVACAAALQNVLTGALQCIIQLKEALNILRLLVPNPAKRHSMQIPPRKAR